MLLSSLGTSAANVALPSLAEVFDASFQGVQWVVLAYLLTLTATIVSVGRLGDVIGRRRLLQLGLMLFTAAAAAAGVAPTLGMLIAARAAQGLGAAVMMALPLAFVSEIVGKAKLGSAMGLLGTMSAIGTALGPSLAGALIDVLGWRAIFLVNVPLGLVATVMVARQLPVDRRPSTRVAFDHLGTLLLALTLAAYVLAMTLGRGQFGPLNVALLAAAALGVALFGAVERHATAPLIRLAMLREPALRTSLVANLLVSTVLMATLVVGPFYLSRGLGLEVGALGLVMSVGPIVAALTGAPAGRLVDRLGTRRMTLIGLAGIAGGSCMLAVVPATLGIPGYLAPIIVITASYAVFQAANNTAVMHDVAPEQRGVVAGTLTLSRNLGLITGTSVMGAVFALAVGTSDFSSAAPEAVAAGMRVTFAIAAALIVLAGTIVAGLRARLAWVLVALLVPSVAAAQPPDAARPDARGFVLRSADQASSLRVLGLFQPQLAHRWTDGVPDQGALFINRARVGLLGSMLDGNLQVMLVAELGGGDPRLLFANLDFTVIPKWLTVRIGQFKRPFSRSFITMASQMSMIERPMTIGPQVFGDDADIGVMLHNGSEGRLEVSLGVFTGTGPGVVTGEPHPLLAARVGYQTGGLEPYSESDLEGGRARVGVAAAGLVDFDVHGDDGSFASGLVDVMLKARGFSLSSAIHVGARQTGSNWREQQLHAVGHYTQIGHVIAHRFEPVARYAVLARPGNAVIEHDVAGGFNLFVRGHALKWQNSVNVRLRPELGHHTADVSVRSQLSVSF